MLQSILKEDKMVPMSLKQIFLVVAAGEERMGKMWCLGGSSFSFLSLFCFEREKHESVGGSQLLFQLAFMTKVGKPHFQKQTCFLKEMDDFQVTLHLKIRFFRNDL